MNFHTDYIDTLLIHRPDLLIDVEEVAATISTLKKSGKIKKKANLTAAAAKGSGAGAVGPGAHSSTTGSYTSVVRKGRQPSS